MNTNKIKIEPGTSKLPSVLKYEEGRLQSLVTRNLKLTSTSRPKVFKPNLVERKKKNDVIVDTIENNRVRGRGRGRGGDRGRGALRGRNSQNFIQSHGIFSEGMSDAQKKNMFHSDRVHSSSKDSDASKIMDKPTFNKNADYKIDKEHEEKVMLELYDDHIEQEQDIVNEIYPINLPTIPQIKDKPIAVKQKKIMKIKEDPDAADVISNIWEAKIAFFLKMYSGVCFENGLAMLDDSFNQR